IQDSRVLVVCVSLHVVDALDVALFAVLVGILYASVFFFSSRRRHTRFSRDWSSDVCSSDLAFVGRTDSAAVADEGLVAVTWTLEIGRASCRERVEFSGAVATLKKASSDLLSDEGRVFRRRGLGSTVKVHQRRL